MSAQTKPRTGKSGPMPHPKGAIWAERLLLAFILAALGGTLNLVVAVYRHAAIPSPSPRATVTGVSAPAKTPQPPPLYFASSPKADMISQDASIEPERGTSPQPPEQPKQVTAEELTEQAVARLSAAISTEIAALETADRRVQQLEAARKTAIAESQRWKRRELLVRQQIDGLSRRAETP